MTNSLNKINKIIWLAGGAGLTLLAWLTTRAIPQPITWLHTYNLLSTLPPLWLLRLLWCLSYFLMGGAWLSMLCIPTTQPRIDTLKYKGGMFLVLTALFTLAWYLVLFGTDSLWLSWICLALALIAGGYSALCYGKLVPLMGWSVVLALLFWIYLWLMQLMVMLHI